MTKVTFRSILRARGVNRIVLLRRRNTPCPKELAETTRGLEHMIEAVQDPLNALAAICVLVRREQPRIDFGLEPQQRIAFLYSELEWAEDEDTSIPELLAFLKKALPEISLWNLTTGGLALEIGSGPAVPPPSNATEPPAAVPKPPKPNFGNSSLKLTGSFEREDPPQEPEHEAEDGDSEASEAKSPETDHKEADPDSTQPRTEITLDELKALRGEFTEAPPPDSKEPLDPEEPRE
ncbi:MAG: hypothetical protein CBC35_03785 [Planctomycetes bacterium TMED75]|nr:hypothetical protein [Planctomycetaceae bacterium]OUU94610.1 MAG: hypothetical protein CBC35_03785 [Planctomycetes bacterium TMED75]